MRALFFTALLLSLTLGGLTAASLWQAETLADGNLYSDQVARKPGDLITILVKETTSVTDDQKTTTKRENDLNAQVKMVPGTSRLPAVQGASTIDTLPGVTLESKKEFDGEGKYTAKGEVRAVITGRVTDVLDNGNLVIEGRRTMRVNLDSKTIVVSCVIRTADIRSDNTVASEKLHNFQVAIEGEGPMTRAQQEGWLGRLFDVVWPF